MKKTISIFLVCGLCLGFAISLLGCNRQGGSAQLAVPSNLRIIVRGRLMTVSWNAVENASGYLIRTTSTGCASGNRIVNTSTMTATTDTGAAVNSASAAAGIRDRGNGFVTFTGDTSFTIWLMPASGSETTVMASSLSANIIALGDGVNYRDSRQSSNVTLNRSAYLP